MDGFVHRVKDLIYDTLCRHGADRSATHRETLLIREGAYCGHRYCLDEFSAVWFIEEDEIKFYGTDGGVIDHIHPSSALSSRAA